MAQERAQATLKPPGGRALDETPRNDAAGSPPLERRIFSLRNIVSVFLTLGVLYLVCRQVLGSDWGEVWASVRGASLGLFALAAGLVLSVIGVVGLLAVRRFRWAFELVLPKRLHAHYFRLEHGVIDSFRGRLPLLVVYSVLG